MAKINPKERSLMQKIKTGSQKDNVYSYKSIKNVNYKKLIYILVV